MMPDSPSRPHQNWRPVAGDETHDFLRHIALSKSACDGVKKSAISILSKGTPPQQKKGTGTGLIIGYIQSGKTMSFETVATLAQDNGFQIVIVVTGRSNLLLDQSSGRLRRDLRLDESGRHRRWIQFTNPENTQEHAQTIRDVLDDWRDPETPDKDKKTVLITVLKHHAQLQKLRSLFSILDLQGVAALIIDDEADQASLNNEVQQGQESSTYRRLIDLRQVFPNHTYLQYTATPQAPLLVSIIDSLSPDFVQILEPGDAYVGGREFFKENRIRVHEIPFEEIFTNSNSLTEPPDTLLDALRIFMIGVAAGIEDSDTADNRSMLVHPSHLTTHHQEYYNWVRNIFEEWKRTLNLPNNDPDKRELMADFQKSYDRLKETVPNLLPFDNLTKKFNRAFRNTRIQEMNTRVGPTPEVDWKSTYGWILVGGQAMDRGFTVEGLTVTYMPRGIGGGNADTIQQRARFFGYKKDYLGYCRIYLESNAISAFKNYVDHEEDIRGQLKEFQKTGRPLNEWKRAFVLDPILKPCRKSVLEFGYIRTNFSGGWFSPQIIFSPDTTIATNKNIVKNFLNSLDFNDDAGDQKRTAVQRHYVCEGVALRKVLDDLLIPTRITGPTDWQKNTALLLLLSMALEENNNETCTIYQMSPNGSRERGVDISGSVTNLFQGADPVYPHEDRGKIYPGDREIHGKNTISIQVHMLKLIRDKRPLAESVPVIATWIPKRLARTILVQQEQGN